MRGRGSARKFVTMRRRGSARKNEHGTSLQTSLVEKKGKGICEIIIVRIIVCGNVFTSETETIIRLTYH